MRQYNIQETKEVTKIICNKCGKEIAVENGMAKEDTLSEKDNEVHAFDLCEACYDELISNFRIPIEIE